MTRKFAVANGFENKGVVLPERSTKYSAGYDFRAVEDTIIPSIWQLAFKHFTNVLTGCTEKVSIAPTKVHTGVKAYMEDDEYLKVVSRSSNSKLGLLMPHGIAIIDKDFANNLENDGAILCVFWNFGLIPRVIQKGDRVAQGIFVKYLLTDDDNATGVRTGGLGSTGTN